MGKENKRYSNLTPFTGVNDPRRQNGRRKGSKNIATLVRSILDEDIDPSLIHSESLKELLAKNNSPMSYMEAIVQSQMLKAAGGDIRAAEWVVEQSDKAPDPDSFFSKTNIVFHVVPPPQRDKNSEPFYDDNGQAEDPEMIPSFQEAEYPES